MCLTPYRFCLVSLLFWAIVTVGSCSGAIKRSVVFSQVVHRHGARTPFIAGSTGSHCSQLGCGTLNTAGKQMLWAVGDWARDRYINGTAAASTTTTQYMNEGSVVGGNYSAQYIVTRSTDTARTIQSADGFLRGMFPDLDQFYPVISTGPDNSLADDTLLRVDALPAYEIPVQVQQVKNWAAVIPAIEKLNVFDTATVEALGNELGLADLCVASSSNNNKVVLTQCLLNAQDVAASLNVTGQLQAGSYPMGLRTFASLMQVRRLWNELMFTYNSEDNAVDAARGSLGQNLAQELMSNMNEKISDISSASTSSSYYFKEYSTHANTVMSLCSTLGANELMLPLFGESFFFELLQLEEETGSPFFHVRALYGHPEQSAANAGGSGSHSFTSNVFPLKCINITSNMTYTLQGSEDSCPLADWYRFIESSLPNSVEGLCYLEPSIFSTPGSNMSDCSPSEAATQATPSSSLCAYYRRHCSQWACGTNGKSVVALSDLRCVATALSVNANDSTEHLARSTETEVIVVSVAGAVAVTVLVCLLVLRWIPLGRQNRSVETSSSAPDEKAQDLLGNDYIAMSNNINDASV